MKKFLMFSIAMLLTCGMYAQNDDYDRVSGGYTMMMFHQKVDDKASTEQFDRTPKFHGGELNYYHGFSLSDKTPLFVEVGIRLTFNLWKDHVTENKYERNDRYTMIATSIPVNLTYRINLGGDFYLAPFAGAQFRFNDVAKRKGSTRTALNLSNYNDNLLNGIDSWRRIQVGGQAGINIGYQHFNVGIAYMMYTPILSVNRENEYRKYRFDELSCTVGYNF